MSAHLICYSVSQWNKREGPTVHVARFDYTEDATVYGLIIIARTTRFIYNPVEIRIAHVLLPDCMVAETLSRVLSVRVIIDRKL